MSAQDAGQPLPVDMKKLLLENMTRENGSVKQPLPKRSIFYQICLSSYWFGLSVITASFGSVIWPSQVLSIVGNSSKDFYMGLLACLTSLVLFVLSPFVGMISDHWKGSLGRRRPFMIVGTVITAVFFMASSFHTTGSSFWVLLGTSVAWMFGVVLSNAPFVALMPDVISEEQRGTASSILAFTVVLGGLSGALCTGALSYNNYYIPAYAFNTIVIVAFLLPTVIFVREEPLHEEHPKLQWQELAASFVLRGTQYHDLWRVTHGRFWFDMAVCGIIPYLQYYFVDVLLFPPGGPAERLASSLWPPSSLVVYRRASSGDT
eukprot:CAMPEP_0196660074 /NCGR_PEP_ID=MMETSP1086-20130531/37958_1 /TAXON_ID=77921 /ORGANISM="Cyanoptyche  gloeocystis , Strain SAG4.97" /LENGTH=318 /DNA_ID=CAMNT_0041994313 /DNA_START=76 /DNA_END=1033 /DNA_ORIENTATION=-